MNKAARLLRVDDAVDCITPPGTDVRIVADYATGRGSSRRRLSRPLATSGSIEKSDDTQALVLELVEGPTLADRIAKGPIPKERRERMRDMGDARLAMQGAFETAISTATRPGLRKGDGGGAHSSQRAGEGSTSRAGQGSRGRGRPVVSTGDEERERQDPDEVTALPRRPNHRSAPHDHRCMTMGEVYKAATLAWTAPPPSRCARP